MNEDGERAAQRLRVERGVRHLERDRIVPADRAVFGELRRREFRAHGRERRLPLRERGGRESRAGKVEPDTDARMGRGKARDHRLEHVAHVVVADHGDDAVAGDIGGVARQLDGLRLVLGQRRVDARREEGRNEERRAHRLSDSA